MNNLPTGTVTFLFTDIEGSTKLSQQYPDAMPVILARHNQILHQAIEGHNGYVFPVVGDSFAAPLGPITAHKCAEYNNSELQWAVAMAIETLRYEPAVRLILTR